METNKEFIQRMREVLKSKNPTLSERTHDALSEEIAEEKN